MATSLCPSRLITLKTRFNKVHPFKRFVYHKVSFRQQGEPLSLVAEIIPRSNSKLRCSGCSKPAPGYDHMPTPRLFAFVPLWNIPVSFSYLMRRVQCPDCSVKVEEVPWAQDKRSCCDAYRHFLASWAKRLSWKETAQRFQNSWDNVCRSGQFRGFCPLQTSSIFNKQLAPFSGTTSLAGCSLTNSSILDIAISVQAQQLTGQKESRRRRTLSPDSGSRSSVADGEDRL